MTAAPEWRVEMAPIDYPEAVAAMEARAAAIAAGEAPELIWLLEHPPLYTAGTSADPGELRDPSRFPVFTSGRGGRYTYHGPGQRIVYVMLDLNRRGRDVRRYVAALESWIIAALADFGIAGHTACGRIGVWVDGEGGERKIAALGVRIRRWVSLHGFAINVAPDLEHFAGIVPCGLEEYGVTSLRERGSDVGIGDVDAALAAHFDAFLQTLSPSAMVEQSRLRDSPIVANVHLG